jgi:hypothetical protein
VTTIPYNPGISIYLIRQAVTSMHWNNTKTVDHISVFQLLNVEYNMFWSTYNFPQSVL